jgi:hypothetical protein
MDAPRDPGRGRARTRAPIGVAATLLAAALALALVPLGCGVASAIKPTTCDRSNEANPPILYTEGTVEDAIFMSSPWTGELLDFPGGRRYLIEHKLGKAPRSVELFLSFSRYGASGDDGSLAPASGNQAEIRCVNDKYITIANYSCVDYWLLVVATAGSSEGSDGDGSGGSGGSDGSDESSVPGCDDTTE